MGVDRLTVVARDLEDLPLWFLVVGVATGVVVALAVTVVGPRRPSEALGLVAVGLVGAAAAVPDTELVALAVVLLSLADLGLAVAPTVPARGWRPIAALVGLTAGWALLDGAQGRAGTVLLAPVVVAPVAIAARWAGRGDHHELVVRLAIGLVVGVATARLTGLGDGTLRPAVGGLVGAVVVAAFTWCLAPGERRTT